VRVVVVSGYSGSGKTTALNILEDVGFICIDNLPAILLPTLIREMRENGLPFLNKLAIGIDARNPVLDHTSIPRILQEIKASGIDIKVIFLTARHGDLMRRFSETRRKHPLTTNSLGLIEAINKEELLLAPIETITDYKVDTTGLALHQLRKLIKNCILPKNENNITILFESFGYKRGLPINADFVFDIRCLPNPYWKTSLRRKTGLDHDVVAFLQTQPEVIEMLSDITNFLDSWICKFEANHRSYLTIAIGCTGGQHRSVYISSKLYEHFSVIYPNTQINHKELSIPETSVQ
tara:strand:- start:615 stop:1493 length:879 start_codon:yes stop_codon:yes gene_type:complete